MRVSNRHLLPTLGGLVLVFYSCNVQPGDAGRDPSGSSGPTLAPERIQAEATPAARPTPAELAPRPQVIAPAPAEVRPSGPMASQPTPLPKADQRIAIFHSSNVEGELDPCG